MSQYFGDVVHANPGEAGRIELHICGYWNALVEADVLIRIPMIDRTLVPNSIERWLVFGCRRPQVNILVKDLF
ncbi:MAG: hypothetical protein P8J55_08280 [Pseudomonadales bacterium]|nr:hypothetical protein [Pseudomonadales bacterium]